MISFFLCLLLLIGGYFVYGKIVENTFAPDDRETPAVKINDGVDYIQRRRSEQDKTNIRFPPACTPLRPLSLLQE